MRTAIAPSPTADATRLTDPVRTSPAAKTPVRLDSRSKGPLTRSLSVDAERRLPMVVGGLGLAVARTFVTSTRS